MQLIKGHGFSWHPMGVPHPGAILILPSKSFDDEIQVLWPSGFSRNWALSLLLTTPCPTHHSFLTALQPFWPSHCEDSSYMWAICPFSLPLPRARTHFPQILAWATCSLSPPQRQFLRPLKEHCVRPPIHVLCFMSLWIHCYLTL